tara:strand:- start:590 stop:763 length:174 start_codon:yes stop_codon:yes gene_type:complete
MTLVDTSSGRASDRKVIRKALTTDKKVSPSINVRDSSDYTRVKRLIEKNKKMYRDAK